MLTIIVPVDLKRRRLDLIIKIKELLNRYKTKNVSFIISHNDRGSIFDWWLKKIAGGTENVTILSERFYSGQINNSILRNRAAALVKTPVALLLDVDVYIDEDLLVSCAEKIASKETPFILLPCLYLSSNGSRLLRKGRKSVKWLFEQYLNFNRAPFLHLASPSSVVFFEASLYKKVSGFDERFEGHGYEDFDFLIRLAIECGFLSKESDFLTDKPCRSPLFARGFRRELGKLSLPHVLDGKLSFHLHHKKDALEDYYLCRLRNRKIFEEKFRMSALYSSDSNLDLITLFFDLVSNRDQHPDNYAILFDNRPGHVDRLDSVWRKFKFLFDWS